MYKSALTEPGNKDQLEPRVSGPVSVDETDWPDVEEVPTDERLELVNELADEDQGEKPGDKDGNSLEKVLANANIDDEIAQVAPEVESSKSNLSFEEDAEEELPNNSSLDVKDEAKLTQEQDGETEETTEEREQDCAAAIVDPPQESEGVSNAFLLYIMRYI